MGRAIVLEAQKGLWIEEHLLQQAQLGDRIRVVVEEGEIRILPVETVPHRFPYQVTADEAQAALKAVREEVVALYGGQPPPDQPYFGGVTWREYQGLPDEERRALWDRLYAGFDVEIEANEERCLPEAGWCCP